MKEFIKKPESWKKPVEASREKTSRSKEAAVVSKDSEVKVDPNKQRIEAKIAELKSKFTNK